MIWYDMMRYYTAPSYHIIWYMWYRKVLIGSEYQCTAAN